MKKLLITTAAAVALLLAAGVHVRADEKQPANAFVILTPPSKPQPRINSARVFGLRPGSPCLYTVAATGQRPLRFSARGLPAGLLLDGTTGRITGALSARGVHRVTLVAENALGRAERELRIVVGDEFALTPPLGCNTYGGWGPHVTEANIRASAEAMVKLGLADHGYCYVNIDDGWQGARGGKYNAIQPNEKFGDMARLCADLHAMGLKAGTYSTPYTSSYEGFIGGTSDDPKGAWVRPNPPRSGIGHFGRFTFERNDARQAAEWGFDYFKYDWGIDTVARARAMSDALRATERDIVLELSNSAPRAQAEAFTALAQMCRTTGDIVDVWDRSQLDAAKQKWALGVRDIWNEHKHWQKYNRPGHWNMPCPLRVGLLGGWDLKPLRPTRLTADEQYTHVSLWCLWSAPLIIGCPLERLDAFTLGLLVNDEVLEVDQDPLGRQARDVEVNGGAVLVKPMEDGSTAVGLFNVGPAEATITARWSDLGIIGPRRVRDLWRQADLGVFDGRFSAAVRSHGVVLVRLFAQ